MAKVKTTVKKTKEENRIKPDSRWKRFRDFLKNDKTKYAFGLFLVLFALYLFLALLSFLFTGANDQSKLENIALWELTQQAKNIENWTGPRGAYLANLMMNEWMGISSFGLVLFLMLWGRKLMKLDSFSLLKWFFLISLVMTWLSVALSFFFLPFFPDSFFYLGGKTGAFMCQLVNNNFGKPGTLLLLMCTLGIFLIFTLKSTPLFLNKLFGLLPFWRGKAKPDTNEEQPIENNEATNDSTEQEEDEEEQQQETETEESLEWEDDEPENPTAQTKQEEEEDMSWLTQAPASEEMEQITPAAKEEEEVSFTIESKDEEAYDGSQLGKYDPTLDLPRYKYPICDLLRKYESYKPVDHEEQRGNKQRIIETLENYGIKISRIEATVGPTITLYEIVPAPGVRISKIKNLENDIALSLAALGIRIIAPIPGKGTIGIEVPNKDPQTVSMQSILFSKKFQECSYDLPIALGKTITNDIFIVDLCKMPHILVAGATGQGKSVGLNAIITSLLYKKHPSQLKFVLIDPKKVEFNIYAQIEKHFLAKLPDAEEAIITDFTKVVETLKSLTIEMDTRYDLLKKAHARNVKEYNAKFVERRLNPEKGHHFLPYIVVIIDEFGDLIMTAGKDVELPIARIAQLARAVGIHMVIATQRPSTNIITGSIKANFPARLAFRVSSMIDSRTILDSPGANQLIGRGDMLFSQGSDQTRVQCAFVDTPEVEAISEFIGTQTGYPLAFQLPEYVGEENGGNGLGSDWLSDKDPLFDEAARLLVTHQQGSTSLIQRKFSIGYNRAGRLVDQLEAAGVVGPFEGSKARQVLVADEVQLERILENYRQ